MKHLATRAATLGATALLVALCCGRDGAKERPPSAQQNATHEIRSQEHLEQVLDGSGTGLLLFQMYANWCIPCRLLSPVLDSLVQKNAGRVRAYRVNVDRFPLIAQRFGVRGIPHVAFVRHGRVALSVVGLKSAAVYDRAIREFQLER